MTYGVGHENGSQMSGGTACVVRMAWLHNPLRRSTSAIPYLLEIGGVESFADGVAVTASSELHEITI